MIPFCAGLTVASGGEPQEMVRFTDTVPALGGKNLVPNGSFETGTAGWSSLGQGAGENNAWAPLADANWGNFDSLHGTVEKNGAAHGQSFLRIRLGGEHTPVFHFDYWDPVDRRELRPLAANLGWIEVIPGQPYTISLSMRASRGGVRGTFGVHNEDAGRGWSGAREDILQNVTLTSEWQRYSRTFVPRYPYVFVLAGPNLTVEENVSVDVDAIQLEQGARATDFTPQAGLEIGVTPTALAGVFTTGGPAALKITAFNAGKTGLKAQIIFKVTDYFDQPVELTGADLAIPAGATVAKLVSLPTDWRGYYRVMATCTCGDTTIRARPVRLTIVPPRTSRQTVLGVNHAYPTENLIGLAKHAGVSWYRDWSLIWQHIEPARGKYRWDISDPQINHVAAQGLNLTAMIPFPSAEWNSVAPDLATIRSVSPRYAAGGQGDDQELLIRARWAWMPRDINELNGFVAAAAGRYKNQIQVWEFLNEALSTTYSLPSQEVLKTSALKSYTVRDYLALLQTTIPAFRAGNPGARIIGGGMFPDNSAHEIVKNGLLDYVDIFALHDYPSSGMRTGGGAGLPEQVLLPFLNALQETMRAHGGPKPLWLTEFSYYGTDDLSRQPFIPIPGLWSEPQLLSEKQVADYTIRYGTIFLSRGGEKIFLHSGCTGSVNKPGTDSCLFADGAVRKVFPALAVFTEMLGPSPKFIADKTVGRGFAFAFETGKQAVLILWDPEGNTTVALPSGVTCQDLMGRTVTGPSVALNGSPVYLLGQSGQANTILATCARTMTGHENSTK